MHRTYPTIHKEKPIRHLIELATARRKTDLEVLVVAGDEVLHDTSRLEEADLVAVVEGVC